MTLMSRAKRALQRRDVRWLVLAEAAALALAIHGRLQLLAGRFRRGDQLCQHAAVGEDLGSGRILGSEIEAPNMLANLVRRE